MRNAALGGLCGTFEGSCTRQSFFGMRLWVWVFPGSQGPSVDRISVGDRLRDLGSIKTGGDVGLFYFMLLRFSTARPFFPEGVFLHLSLK